MTVRCLYCKGIVEEKCGKCGTVADRVGAPEVGPAEYYHCSQCPVYFKRGEIFQNGKWEDGLDSHSVCLSAKCERQFRKDAHLTYFGGDRVAITGGRAGTVLKASQQYGRNQCWQVMVDRHGRQKYPRIELIREAAMLLTLDYRNAKAREDAAREMANHADA